MSDEDTQHDDTESRWLAKMVRGGVYYLGPMRFDRGAVVVIDQHHKDHLHEHAREEVADDDLEITVKHRFRFEPYDGTEPAGTIIGWDERMKLEDAEGNEDAERQARMRAFQAKERERMGLNKSGPIPVKPFQEPARDDEDPETEQPLSVIRSPARTPVHNELTAVQSPAARARTRTRG